MAAGGSGCIVSGASKIRNLPTPTELMDSGEQSGSNSVNSDFDRSAGLDIEPSPSPQLPGLLLLHETPRCLFRTNVAT